MFGVAVGAAGIMIKVGQLKESMATKEALNRAQAQCHDAVKALQDHCDSAVDAVEKAVLGAMKEYVSEKTLTIHLNSQRESSTRIESNVSELNRKFEKVLVAVTEVKQAIDVRNNRQPTNWGYNQPGDSPSPERHS